VGHKTTTQLSQSVPSVLVRQKKGHPACNNLLARPAQAIVTAQAVVTAEKKSG